MVSFLCCRLLQVVPVVTPVPDCIHVPVHVVMTTLSVRLCVTMYMHAVWLLHAVPVHMAITTLSVHRGHASHSIIL